MARARVIVILGLLTTGTLGVIAATQTWVTVTLDDGSLEQLAIPGSSAIPLLTPLSLAVLAIGAAMSLAGRVLRHILSALALLIGVTLGMLVIPLALTPPLSAVAADVAAATGIAGEAALASLVIALTATPWPWITAVSAIALTVVAIWALITATRWGESGRKYRSGSTISTTTDGPLDAIDSWDDLSRGTDPTRPID
ncbi:hypothetical protein GCM10009808_08390 [Microbacterium sediminicola]|uniref:Tryptophan-associated transmembrane protein (Trp_oprn_chp) n=1 Tax=Microbacterium sediminicola TaxID=415210 RepID=A0ABP4TTQ2_9MICO